MQRSRVVVIAGVIAAASIIIFCLPRANDSRQPTTARGELFDAAGRQLTRSGLQYQAALNLGELRKLPPARSAQFLSEVSYRFDLAQERLALVDHIRSVERQLPVRVSAEALQSHQQWLQESEWGAHHPALLRFLPITSRSYPYWRASAPLVGTVDPYGHGIEGMEWQLNEELAKGSPIQLSVDIQLQSRVALLLEQVHEHQPLQHINAVVIDLQARRLASLISLPNAADAVKTERNAHLRMRAATDVFQAGPMLEPLLLHGILNAHSDQGARLSRAFVEDNVATGIALAKEFRDYEQAVEHLQSVGLLRTPAVDLPGAVPALVRRDGSEQERLHDLGTGAAIAPSLLQYSGALATVLTGETSAPFKLVLEQSASAHNLKNLAFSSNVTHALREALIKRARVQSGNPQADFGGLWASYKDQGSSSHAQRSVIALFAPAHSPKFLVTIVLEGSRALASSELLALGERVLRPVLETPIEVAALSTQ